MSFWTVLACLAAGYLCGNFQTAILISKKFYRDDIRNHGSGNAGSTNMVRVYGWLPGLCTFLGDFIKAVLAYQLGTLILGANGGILSAGAEVIGHCFPVFYGFRGGKGVASSYAIAFMTFPLGALITSAVIAVAFYLTKKISVCSLSGILAFFLSVVFLSKGNVWLIVLSAFLLVLIYYQHRENIKRLIRGEEKQILN